jgi:hypothetical protein
MYWTRDGAEWVLKLGRRKLGRVFSRQPISRNVAVTAGGRQAVRYG